MMTVVTSTGLFSDRWLSGLFGHPAWRVDANASGAIEAVQASKGRGFFYARVPTSEVERLHRFEDVGFRVVDVSISLTADVEALRLPPPGPGIRFARETDKDAVVSIAAQAFDRSRFHLDPLIPREIADRSRREWVANFFTGERGDALVVAESDKTPGAFLLLIGPKDRTWTIDLIATNANFRRQGLGAACLAYAVRNLCDAERVSVGTQAANVSSLRFYESLGFRTAATAYVLHLHRR